MAEMITDLTKRYGLSKQFLLFIQAPNHIEELKKGDKEYQCSEICRFFKEVDGEYTKDDLERFIRMAEDLLDMDYIVGYWDRKGYGENRLVAELKACLMRREITLVPDGEDPDNETEDVVNG